jgi:hypothetical protein
MPAVAALSENINTKLGQGIYAWSLPVDEATCIGASFDCMAECYAKRGHFVRPAVRRLYQRNKEFAKTDPFVGWTIGALRQRFMLAFRLHVSGDFFDAEYTNKWYDIIHYMHTHPNVRVSNTLVPVRFFAYTRSWRDASVLPALIRLSTLPNMRLWFSLDRSTGSPPLVPGIKRAYMARTDLDASYVPDDCDLVFRVRPKTVMKRTNGVLVCPAENSVVGKIKHTCTSCQLCWNGGQRAQWEDYLCVGDDDGIEINAPEEMELCSY